MIRRTVYLKIIVLFGLLTIQGVAPAETDDSVEAYRLSHEAKVAKAKKNVEPGEEDITKMSLEKEPVFLSSGTSPHRGAGPYNRLVLRGANLIDGTGTPVVGPVDIVVENDRIADIVSVGKPGVPTDERKRPSSGNREIDATGMYVLPGFINSHGHANSHGQVPSFRPYGLDYVYKLWLAHGITTVVSFGGISGSLRWDVKHVGRIAKGEVDGPDILPYPFFLPSNPMLNVSNDKEARHWVQAIAKAGAKGIKLHSGSPELLRAVIEEAKKVGIPTTMHHAQIATPRANVLDTARWGLTSMEHFWYGLPEALFEKQRLQRYPANHNYQDEQDRFRGAARIWAQAAPPYSDKWNAVMNELLALDFTISPTFAIKNATRNVMAAARKEWLDQYTMPQVWEFFTPSRKSHGSFFFDWTTADEVAAAEDYRLGMTFVNEYKNRGGRVTTGEDAGFVYCLYGFCYINELELLQEAGFSPLEVVRAATLHGAQALGIANETGTVEIGKEADLVIVGENPLQNFKVLYGTGHQRLNDKTGRVERVGGIEYTIRDGIVFNAKELLADVREMVKEN